MIPWANPQHACNEDFVLLDFEKREWTYGSTPLVKTVITTGRVWVGPSGSRNMPVLRSDDKSLRTVPMDLRLTPRRAQASAGLP